MSLKLFFSLKLTNVQRVPLNFFRNLLRQNVFQFRMLRLCLCTYSENKKVVRKNGRPNLSPGTTKSKRY